MNDDSDLAGDVKILEAKVVLANGYAEDDPRLAQEVVVMVGEDVSAARWARKAMPLGSLIATLAKHREGSKEGLAMVFADLAGGRRKKDKVRAVYALGLDLDGSPLTGSELDSKLAELDFLAVRATTHSHVRKGERHRVIIPLATPFRPGDYASLRDAERQWRATLKTVGAQLGVEPDAACCDLARAYYLPRHAAGAEHSSTIVGGELLDIGTLDLSAALARPARQARRAVVTPGGVDLSGWGKRRADTFLLTEAIRDHCPDIIRNEVVGGLEIECPNDAEHSNAGDPDDRACLVRDAPDNPEGERFVVSCLHQHCQGLGPLDMLGMMIEAGWIPSTALEDDAYHVEVETPVLTPDSATADLEMAIRTTLKRAAGEVEAARELEAIRIAVKLAKRPFGKIVARVQAAEGASREPDDVGIEVAKAKAIALLAEFPPPPAGERTSFAYRTYQDRPWLYADEGGDHGLRRLWTPWTIEAGVVEIDHDNRQGVRVRALDQDGRRSVFNVSAADVFAAGGLTFKTRLREAGVGLTEAGEGVAVRRIREHVPTRPIKVYRRAGWRGPGLFLTPWGSASTDEAVELDAGSIPEGAEFTGTLEGWRRATAAAWGADVISFKIAPLVAFGAVLTDLCGADSTWVALTGSTSKGKTTTAQLMAAVWGDPAPRQGLYGPLNGTEGAAEARLAQASGAGYAFDETALVSGDRLQTLIFTGAGGAVRDRLTRSARLRSARTWRGMFLITGEHDLSRKIRDGGGAATTGVGTRVLEIDCEDAPALDSETMASIRGALANYGQAGVAFVRAMIDSGVADDPDRLWSEVEALAARLAGKAATPATFRAARIAATLWRAGELARDAGLLPKRADVEGVIRDLWDKARESDLAPDSAEDGVVDLLFEFLIRNRGGRVADGIDEGLRLETAAWRLTPGDYLGKAWPWADYGEADEGVYVVTKATLAAAVHGQMNGRKIVKALATRGALIRAGDDRDTWQYVSGLGRLAAVVIPVSSVEDDAGGAADEGGDTG